MGAFVLIANYLILMETTIMNIQLLNDATFATATAYFTSADRKADTEQYYSWIVSSLSRYLEEGDVKFLNDVTLSTALMGRVRLVRSVTDLVAAHAFGKTGYIGKATKRTLAENRDNSEKLLAKAEGILLADTVQKAAKKTEVLTPEQVKEAYIKRMTAEQAKLLEVGFSIEDIKRINDFILDQSQVDTTAPAQAA